MKSSTGEYFVGLDHIRALAVFLVFTWHFLHAGNGHLAPAPAFPLSLLSEGHTGVALFMTLSGYLFAKLLDGRSVSYTLFVWNRFLRLAPLLFLVVLVVGFQYYLSDNNIATYAKRIAAGTYRPTLPNGGWSITVEFHFYLLLPLLLFLSRNTKYSLLFVLVSAIFIRGFLYYELGQMQHLSYWTIVGRIDQFILGMVAYQFRHFFTGKHLLVSNIFVLFATFYWYFDMQGGFYTSATYPSKSPIWIYLPTIEGIAYASIIAWYDNSFQHSTGRISRFIAAIGTYSYSIYLLHFFVVFRVSRAIHLYVADLSNIYIAMLFAPLGFLIMVPIGYASHHFIESPFLKLRARYVKNQ